MARFRLNHRSNRPGLKGNPGDIITVSDEDAAELRRRGGGELIDGPEDEPDDTPGETAGPSRETEIIDACEEDGDDVAILLKHRCNREGCSGMPGETIVVEPDDARWLVGRGGASVLIPGDAATAEALRDAGAGEAQYSALPDDAEILDADEGEGPEASGLEHQLDEMDKKQLKDYAAEHGVEIKAKDTMAQIKAAILKHASAAPAAA